MKKTLIALASVAALGAAHADVTLYGVIDAAATTVSAGGSTDANNPSNINFLNSYAATGAGGAPGATNGRVTGMGNGLLTPSRWGIKGMENLGGGLKANFVLESGLNIAGGNNPNDHIMLASTGATGGPTGAGDSSLNGQMFDRQASVGLSGDFGSIDAGFQLNLNGELNGANDPFSGGYISPLGTYGGLTGMGSSYTGRASNSFKYAYSMGDTTLKAFYAMGGVSGNAGAGSQTGIAAFIKATPSLDINIGASRMNDNVSYSASAQNSLTCGATTPAQTTNAQTAVSQCPAATASLSGLNGSSLIATSPALAGTFYNATETILGVNYKVSPTLLVKVGYLTVTQSNPSNGTADAAILQNNGIMLNPNATNTAPYPGNYSRNITWIGGTYNLSATDKVILGYYSMTLGAYTKNVNGALISTPVTQLYSSNTQQTFSAVYDHDLSKQTDVYVAGSYATWNSPGIATATTAYNTSGTTAMNQTSSAGQSQSMFALGLRMKF